MWVYEQSTGRMSRDGKLLAVGYSGAPGHINKPADEKLHTLGPLPVGFYTIGEHVNDAKTGQYSMPLIPDPANEMFGRSAFRIHGDSIQHPGTASEGCIIMPRFAREAIWTSEDHALQVITGLPNS